MKFNTTLGSKGGAQLTKAKKLTDHKVKEIPFNGQFAKGLGLAVININHHGNETLESGRTVYWIPKIY